MQSSFFVISLTIDGNDVVAQAGEGWDDFLREYRVASLQTVQEGMSFSSVVASPKADSLFRAMFARARDRYPVAVEVRAFASDRVSGGELLLRSRGFDGAVEISLRLLSQRALEPIPLLDPNAARDHSELSLCVFCGRLRAFEWVDPPVAVQQLRIDQDGPQPTLSEDACRDCEDAVLAQCALSRLQL